MSITLQPPASRCSLETARCLQHCSHPHHAALWRQRAVYNTAATRITLLSGDRALFTTLQPPASRCSLETAHCLQHCSHPHHAALWRPRAVYNTAATRITLLSGDRALFTTLQPPASRCSLETAHCLQHCSHPHHAALWRQRAVYNTAATRITLLSGDSALFTTLQPPASRCSLETARCLQHCSHPHHAALWRQRTVHPARRLAA